jgi:hypothetical protein
MHPDSFSSSDNEKMKLSGHGIRHGLTIILVFKFLLPTAEVVPETDKIPISL